MFKCWTMLVNNNGVEMFIEKVQMLVKISGHCLFQCCQASSLGLGLGLGTV